MQSPEASSKILQIVIFSKISKILFHYVFPSIVMLPISQFSIYYHFFKVYYCMLFEYIFMFDVQYFHYKCLNADLFLSY